MIQSIIWGVLDQVLFILDAWDEMHVTEFITDNSIMIHATESVFIT